MKYLFEAHFKDGSVIVQDAQDQSIFDPTRSAYFDVTRKGLDNLAFFGVHSGDHTYVVDLIDGHFEVDGVAFDLLPTRKTHLPPDGTFELIYWRDHQHDYGPEPDHRVQWRFGWNYTAPSGHIYTQTMVLK